MPRKPIHEKPMKTPTSVMLDDASVQCLRELEATLDRSRSDIVRRAIKQYHATQVLTRNGDKNS